jgi:hypothetical protein
MNLSPSPCMIFSRRILRLSKWRNDMKQLIKTARTGSYIVNGENDCNGCHNGGGPPNFEYHAGGNPYFGQHPRVIDPATYVAGGQNFGPVGPPPSPDIITRNLTLDKTGRPEGGHTLEDFRQIIRNGQDFDHLHPNCSATRTTNCIPTFTGIDCDLLQIMPRPCVTRHLRLPRET